MMFVLLWMKNIFLHLNTEFKFLCLYYSSYSILFFYFFLTLIDILLLIDLLFNFQYCKVLLDTWQKQLHINPLYYYY